MRASVLTVTNPFDPLGSRTRRLVRRRARLRAMAPRGSAPVIALLNGRAVLRAEWRRKLRDGDILVFCVLPRGNPGSIPLRMLLSIALLVFAPYAAGLLLGVPTAAVAGTFLGQATTLGIMLAGSAAINALLPVPQPGQLPSPSPTYTLNAQGNVARVDQAIPVQYGRLLVYPDLAAQPYVEYSGNEQYLFQLLCLGVGEYEIDDIRIEDTPISAFTEIDTEIVAPGDQVTLFPTAVAVSVEVSGQELFPAKPATFVQGGTVITVTETGHGRVAGQAVELDFVVFDALDGKYSIVSVPSTDTFTVAAPTGANSGSVVVRSIVGGLDGFVASPSGAVAHRMSVDLVLPIGLFSVGGEGTIGVNHVQVIIEARQIDDDGVAIGGWLQLGDETITDRSPTPIRRSYFYTLATPGRYRIRARRVNPKHPSIGASDQVLLAGLRAYLREDEDFGAVTLIALRMRATNNLSRQASRKISVLATRKVAVWNGATWSAPQASRSIA